MYERERRDRSEGTMVKENTFGDRLVKPGDLDTIRGTAEFLGLLPNTVKSWVDAGLLSSIRYGNVVLVHLRDAGQLQIEMEKRREKLQVTHMALREAQAVG